MLLQKKYRQAERKFIVEGVHVVEEALRSDWTVETLLISKEFSEKNGSHGIISATRGRHIEIYQISEKELDKLSDAVTAQGVLAIVKIKEGSAELFWSSFPKKSLIVGLENISDPGNMGTILRTCDWFGVDAVAVSKDSVDVFNPKVLRSTMGSLFHLPVLADADLFSVIRAAKGNGFHLVITSVKEGTSLDSFKFPPKHLIVFGNEAHGVSRELIGEADHSISIPKYGKADSLNVAIACGVVLGQLKLGKG